MKTTKITLSKKQWLEIGNKAGWIKTSTLENKRLKINQTSENFKKEAGLGDALKGAWQGFQ